MSSKLTVRHISGSGTSGTDGSTPSYGAQLLIFSGSGLGDGPAAGYTSDPIRYTDTNMWVSGSACTRTSRHRGVAVFGGDLVVSGGIYHEHDPTKLAGVSMVQGAHGDIVTAGLNTAQSNPMTPGGLYYLTSAGVWVATNSSNTALSLGMNQLLGIALSVEARGGVLIRGWIKVSIQGSASNKGGMPVYAHTTSGQVSTDQPSSAGNWVRIVGYCVDDAGILYFTPSNDWIEL